MYEWLSKFYQSDNTVTESEPTHNPIDVSVSDSHEEHFNYDRYDFMMMMGLTYGAYRAAKEFPVLKPIVSTIEAASSATWDYSKAVLNYVIVKPIKSIPSLFLSETPQHNAHSPMATTTNTSTTTQVTTTTNQQPTKFKAAVLPKPVQTNLGGENTSTITTTSTTTTLATKRPDPNTANFGSDCDTQTETNLPDPMGSSGPLDTVTQERQSVDKPNQFVVQLPKSMHDYHSDTTTTITISTKSSGDAVTKREIMVAENDNAVVSFAPLKRHQAHKQNYQPTQMVELDLHKLIAALKCPISGQVMHQPVLCTLDDTLYERNAIEEYLKQNNRTPSNVILASYSKMSDVITPITSIKELMEHISINKGQCNQIQVNLDSLSAFLEYISTEDKSVTQRSLHNNFPDLPEISTDDTNTKMDQLPELPDFSPSCSDSWDEESDDFDNSDTRSSNTAEKSHRPNKRS